MHIRSFKTCRMNRGLVEPELYALPGQLGQLINHRTILLIVFSRKHGDFGATNYDDNTSFQGNANGFKVVKYISQLRRLLTVHIEYREPPRVSRRLLGLSQAAIAA